MVNSASTIFTLDIYKPLIQSDKEDKHYVKVGKIAAAFALVIGIIIAPLLGNLDQVFQYIQEYTTFISPGVVAVFILGIFWKRATSRAALFAILASVPLSFLLKEYFPALPFLDRAAFTFLTIMIGMIGISLAETQKGVVDVVKDYRFRLAIIAFIILISFPSGVKFIVESGAVPGWFGFLILGLCLLAFAVLWTEKNGDNKKLLDVQTDYFKTSRIFNISAYAISLILALIYVLLW